MMEKTMAIRNNFHAHVALLKRKGSTDNQLIDWFSDILGQLPQDELLVIAMFYQEDLKLKDIAIVLNREASEVSQLYCNAISRLCNDFDSTEPVRVEKIYLTP